MSDSNIERVLGRLEAKVDALIADMEHDKARRKDQYQRLEAIERKQDATEKECALILVRLEKVEQNTDEFNKWRERGLGALMLISLAAALIGGTLATSWQKILELFK